MDYECVNVGAVIRFRTRHSGWGRQGFYWRTGTVVSVTSRTMSLECKDGTMARIRRTEWQDRAPRRAR